MPLRRCACVNRRTRGQQPLRLPLKLRPRPVAPAPASKPAAVAKPAAQPVPVVSTRTADGSAQTQTYDERVAADQTNLFRPNSEENRLSGPKVLGKIDVNLLEKKATSAAARNASALPRIKST